MTLTRSAWAGQQRYGTFAWSGDTITSGITFRAQISGASNVGMGSPALLDCKTPAASSSATKAASAARHRRELLRAGTSSASSTPSYRIHGTDVVREPYRFGTPDPTPSTTRCAAPPPSCATACCPTTTAWPGARTPRAISRARSGDGLPRRGRAAAASTRPSCMAPPSSSAPSRARSSTLSCPTHHPCDRAARPMGNPASRSPTTRAPTSRASRPDCLHRGPQLARAAAQQLPARPHQHQQLLGPLGRTAHRARVGRVRDRVGGRRRLPPWLDDKLLIEDWKNGATRREA